MIDKLIGAVIAIVIGVVLLPVVVDTVGDLNATTMADYPGVIALTNILPLLFVVIIVGGALAYFKYK